MGSLFSCVPKPRSKIVLPKAPGLYALFLSPGAHLPNVDVRADRLLYIGKAAGAGGLLKRCHFTGRTRNHSPRKSLAVLLRKTLGLEPVLITKPNGASTWGLTSSSDQTLSNWMYSFLEVSFVVLTDPSPQETALIAFYAPPLNLNGCAQSPGHQRISAARKAVLASLTASGNS